MVFEGDACPLVVTNEMGKTFYNSLTDPNYQGRETENNMMTNKIGKRFLSYQTSIEIVGAAK